MSLFKQLLTDLRDAAEEITTTLQADLADARGVLRDETDSAAADIQAALSAQAADWDAAVSDHHEQLDAAVHAALVGAFPVDTGAHARRAARVLQRLHQARPGAPAVEVVVLRWEEHNALVLFSHRIYLSTALLDALPDDGAVAFVLGHELTHIDRGDIRTDRELTRRLPPLPPMLPLRHTLGLLTRTWMRPDMERAADAGGQALAVAAGYRADGFEAVFDVLAEHAEEGVEPDAAEWAEFWRQKATGYPSIQERRARLRELATTAPSG